VGRDTIFYLNSPVNIQCRIAGSTVEVNIVLNISQDEQTMTARVQAWAPDAYCRLFLVNQDLTFTKIGNSR
jgi:hypothetical protein